MVLSHGNIAKLITLVVIATYLAYQFSGFSQLPSSSEAYPTWLEKLLKYQLGVWGTPREFWLYLHQKLPTLVVTTSVKTPSME